MIFYNKMANLLLPHLVSAHCKRGPPPLCDGIILSLAILLLHYFAYKTSTRSTVFFARLYFSSSHSRRRRRSYYYFTICAVASPIDQTRPGQGRPATVIVIIMLLLYTLTQRGGPWYARSVGWSYMG